MAGASILEILSTWVYVLLLCTSSHVHADQKGSKKMYCKSQGPLKVQEGKFPAPVRLPFCQQYNSCTCCERRHAQAFGLKIQASLEANSLSPDCRDLTAELACRLCDPEVGVGQKGAVCKETCDAWYSVCSNDYFEYHSLSEELMPCSDDSLVCSQLIDLALNGSDLCRKAGLRVSASGSGKKCFDGSVPAPLEACKAKPQPKPRPILWEALGAKAEQNFVLVMLSAVYGGLLLLFLKICRLYYLASQRSQQQPGVAPTRAAGMAAMERNNRRQS